jgi:hypothetical protein
MPQVMGSLVGQIPTAAQLIQGSSIFAGQLQDFMLTGQLRRKGAENTMY